MLFILRSNESKQIINYSNSIKKSNELSMAKLNQGLSLNQMQLLAYAIFSTQQDGKTEFQKFHFQDKFGVKQYRTEDAYKDSEHILGVKVSTENLEENQFKFWNAFSSMEYDNGHFKFEWNPKMIPHILELKEKYVLTDLTVTSKFRSGFSWILYDYLKAHFGYWHKEMSKEILMELFNVESRKTYQKSTALFKKTVLDTAISEINEYTELQIWYTEKKIGNKITDFTLHWSTGRRNASATDKQITLLREIYSEVNSNLIDYLGLKNSKSRDNARDYIFKIKKMVDNINENLTSKEASNYIEQAKEYYLTLEKLLELDGQERDTSFYYNWLEE